MEANKYSIFELLKSKEKTTENTREYTQGEQNAILTRWRIISFIFCWVIFLWFYQLTQIRPSAFGESSGSSFNPIGIFFRGLKHSPVSMFVICLLAFVVSVIVAYVRSTYFGKPIVVTDEAGDRVIINSSTGVRGILTDEEEAKIFAHSELSDPIGVPIAINRNTGLLIEKIPDLRTDFHWHLANDNILVVGPSGAGKTSGLNLGAAAQHIKLHHGLLIFDPKGDMYPTLVPIDMLYGRESYLFNFKDGELHCSDGWDCLKQIREADIDLAIQLADSFAQIILENGDEQYWTDTIKNLFKMLLLYVTHGNSYEPPTGRRAGDDTIVDHGDINQKRTWRELMRFVTMKSDDLMDIMEAAIEDDEDYELLNDYFTTWAEDKNYSQIRSSLANALDVFKTPAVIDILSSDEIDIDALADGNASIYVACSGRKDTYTPVLTLFVNTVFDRTMTIAEQNGGALDHMLFVLLEEFYSLGRLDMLPRILSQSRSYKISTMISTQTMSQLDKYNAGRGDGSGRSSIESACALQLCVGANEGVGYVNGDTADYFSRRAGLKEKVDDQVTEHRFKPLPEEIQEPLQWNQSKRTTNKDVNAYPPDRIQAITPDEIFISPGPHKCRIQQKYQWSLHPLFGTYAIEKKTGEKASLLTTRHKPVRKGGTRLDSQEYEIIVPARKAAMSRSILDNDTRTEIDFLAP